MLSLKLVGNTRRFDILSRRKIELVGDEGHPSTSRVESSPIFKDESSSLFPASRDNPLVGLSNTSDLCVECVKCTGLLDTGSMI